ncbi:MAG: hypothetical protein KQH79_05955 [Bacteroidetes bacterium]|nr:hypothetical protein [Bacteroidota bacterium]
MKIKPADIEEDREVVGFGDWYSNIFQIDKTFFLAFVNVKTLYAFIVQDIYREDLDDFRNMFIYHLNRSLKLSGFDSDLRKKLISEYSEIKFVKTNSRRTLGYVNDLIDRFMYSISDDVYGGPLNVDEFNVIALKNPIKAFGYKNPREKLVELIDHEILKK